MIRTRSAAVAAILLMTLPALLVVSPAAVAEENVPVAPTVRYELENLFQTNLYINFNDLAPGTPDCQTGALGFNAREETTTQPRAPCAFPVGTSTAVSNVGASSRSFEYGGPIRPFSVYGAGTVLYNHVGSLRAGVTLTAEVRSGTSLIGSGSVTATSDRGDVANDAQWAIPIIFSNQAIGANFSANQPIRLTLIATATPGDAGSVATPTSYTLSDTGSRLEIRSRDALRTATWVGDVKGPPKTLFQPLALNATTAGELPRLQFYFSVQSAFGETDARGPAPIFALNRGNETVRITTQGDPQIRGEYNTSMSLPGSGVATWTLPTGRAIDYRGFVSGEYRLQVIAEHRSGGGYSAGIRAPFLLSAQGVRLDPYTDPDRSVTLAAETLGHEVEAGSETTYLLNITNTGAVNDTFDVKASFVAGTPVTGWSATIGGPSVLQRAVALGPSESKIVAVTIRAPSNAPSGSSSIFRVNATSALDPTAVSPTITLSTSIGSTLRREVAILVPARSIAVTPGVDTEVPVYVWNRGTRAADISLDLQRVADRGWNVDLLQGGVPFQRIVLSNVPPGGIAEATVRVNGPVSEANEHRITLNATQLDASGVAFDRPLTFTLARTGGVSIQILESMGSHPHLVELQGSGGGDGGDGGTGVPGMGGGGCADDGCRPDNVTGVWFRVWVTNTGKITDTYNLTLESVSYASTSSCTTALSQDGLAPGSAGFRFYARSHTGRAVPITHITGLPPGETAEVYVWRAVQGDADPCIGDSGNDFFNFVVAARGERSGFVGTARGEAIAQNSGGKQQVLIEAVGRRPFDQRQPDSGPFLVDLTNASSRALSGLVDVNGSIYYRVRVTNGASWGAYLDAQNNVRAPIVNVYALGEVAFQAGWNISVRPILDTVDNGPALGSANYSFGNEIGSRREAWRDLELEINVTAPSAARDALAGRSGVFFLFAEIPGTEARSTLQVITTIGESANVVARTDTRELQAHPGEAAAALLTVENLGSIAANATLSVSMDPSTQGASAWRVDPAFQSFRLSAAKNRTVALLVTPPAGAGAGSTGLVNVVVDFTPNFKGNKTLQIPVVVVAPGTLDVSTPQTDVTIAPGGYANFTINVKNKGNLPLDYRLVASPLPDWETSIAAPSGILSAGETRSIPYVLRAPATVEDNARFASVVRVTEDGNTANFDAQPLGISILGGKAVAGVTAPLLQKRVDRGGTQAFPIEVRNTGNAAGRIPLEVRSADPAWTAYIQTNLSENLTSIRLGPNDLAVLNVIVRAPANVPERTVVPIEVTAFNEDFTQASRVSLRAEVHDYGVAMSLSPARIDAAPGVPTEFVIKVRNTGNDNDTLNVSAHLPELRDWTVTLSTERVPLEAGQEGEVRATVRSPTSPLPSPRTYGFKIFAGTVGGAAVNLPKNESANAAVVIMPYRALDVDKDLQLELAVDADGRAANGYESFREPFSDGVQTNVAAVTLLDGKTRFLLDVPTNGAPDGIADAWFDPEAGYVYDITLRPDINNDGTPDYLLDTDRDQKIDRAYDLQSETYWNVVEVRALGNDATQYVVDTTGDGRPDYYSDVAAKHNTRILAVSGQGASTVGLDTDSDGEADKYYDYRTSTVTDVKFANASGFIGKYWWFFVLFGVMLVATIALLVARRRRA